MGKSKTAKVEVERIKPNPFRDFRLHPLNEQLIKRLEQSITAHEFWGGLCGRVTEDGSIQQAFGHTRIEAIRRLGISQIEMKIGAYSDDEMLMMLARENCHETNSASTIEVVAGAVKHIATAVLSAEDLGRICHRSPRVAEVFKDNQHAFETSRGLILNGEGVGRLNVSAYLDDLYSESAIREAMSFLRQSGKLAALIKEAVEANKSTIVDLDARREAEKVKAKKYAEIGKQAEAAAAEAEAERLARRKAAIEDAPGASERQNPRIFDEACAQLFSTSTQLSAFRNSVTTPEVRSVLPVDSQFVLGRRCMDILSAAIGDRDKVSGTAIRDWVRQNYRDARASVAEEKTQQTLNAEQNLKSKLSGIIIAAKTLIRLLEETKAIIIRHPELKDSPLVHKIGRALSGLAPHLKEYGEHMSKNAKENEADRERRMWKEDFVDAECEDITPKDNIHLIR